MKNMTLKDDLKEVWVFECRDEKNRLLEKYWTQIEENITILAQKFRNVSWTCEEVVNAFLNFQKTYKESK